MGKLAIASESLFLKHQEGATQHETLLVVSPGSLHMNTSIENIVYTEFTKKYQEVSISECNVTQRRVRICSFDYYKPILKHLCKYNYSIFLPRVV